MLAPLANSVAPISGCNTEVPNFNALLLLAIGAYFFLLLQYFKRAVGYPVSRLILSPRLEPLVGGGRIGDYSLLDLRFGGFVGRANAVEDCDPAGTFSFLLFRQL